MAWTLWEPQWESWVIIWKHQAWGIWDGFCYVIGCFFGMFWSWVLNLLALILVLFNSLSAWRWKPRFPSRRLIFLPAPLCPVDIQRESSERQKGSLFGGEGFMVVSFFKPHDLKRSQRGYLALFRCVKGGAKKSLLWPRWWWWVLEAQIFGAWPGAKLEIDRL